MKTLDTNVAHALALVQDSEGEGRHTRYVPLDEAPATLDDNVTKQVYLHQLHYVASHMAVGLVMHDRLMPDGTKYPRTGWTRWRP